MARAIFGTGKSDERYVMSDELKNPATNANGKPQSYRDLLVWQKSISLAKTIYKLTVEFPPEEKFGLISQMRRAAVSVPSNIAEGQARNTTGEFIQFISHAEGSLAELDTQLILAVELGFATADKIKSCANSIDELRRMLNGLRRVISGQKPAASKTFVGTRK
jgi:four helix bundle protein